MSIFFSSYSSPPWSLSPSYLSAEACGEGGGKGSCEITTNSAPSIFSSSSFNVTNFPRAFFLFLLHIPLHLPSTISSLLPRPIYFHPVKIHVSNLRHNHSPTPLSQLPSLLLLLRIHALLPHPILPSTHTSTPNPSPSHKFPLSSHPTEPPSSYYSTSTNNNISTSPLPHILTFPPTSSLIYLHLHTTTPAFPAANIHTHTSTTTHHLSTTRCLHHILLLIYYVSSPAGGRERKKRKEGRKEKREEVEGEGR